MGNSASALPYSIDKQVGAPHDHYGWAVHEGKTLSNQAPVTVFVGKKPAMSKTPVDRRMPHVMQLQPAYHHYQNCRKLRHPQILKVLATLDTDNPKAATTDGASSSSDAADTSATSVTTGDLIIVTEPCISLDQWLLTNPTPEQLAWGLECVVRALHFLHSSANLAHGCVCPTSFFVTPAGDVKLWNFSLITPVGANKKGPIPQFMEWESAVTPNAYRSPERIETRWDAISNAGIHCMDSFSLGIFIDHLYSGKIPQALQKASQRLQTPNLRMRPRLQPLLKCPVFDTPYQKIQLQLEEISIQPVEQKIALWQTLEQQLQSGLLPKGLAIHKLLPLMKNVISTTCSSEAMLSQDLYRREVLAMIQPLFYIAENFLSSDVIKSLLTPLVGLLFLVKDRGVRGALLTKTSFMTQHLDKNTLNMNVFEPLCSGFSDSSPALRELTLKATMELVPYLTAPNLEKLSRYLIRLQSDPETSIRTNTVIFISRLATYLTDTTRQKLLLPAFVRAMKDPFTPCRMAALQSTLQTKEFFTMAEIANKVMPSIMPLLLDPIVDVRKEAFSAVETLMRSLKEESDRMAVQAQQEEQKRLAEQQQQQYQQQQQQPRVAPAPSSATFTSAATPGVAPAPTSGSYLSGLSSWMSSSTAPTVAVTATTTTTTTAATPAPTSTRPPPTTTTTTTTTTMPMQTPTSLPTSQMSSLSMTAPIPASVPAPIVDDGWGDDDDDDDDGWGDDDNNDDAGIKFPSASNNGNGFRSSTNNNTFTNTTQPMTSLAPAPAPQPTFGGFSTGNDDEDDDPFASIGIKKVGVASRGNAKLIVPKKSAARKPLVAKLSAPPTKLKVSKDDITDGWDDF